MESLLREKVIQEIIRGRGYAAQLQIVLPELTGFDHAYGSANADDLVTNMVRSFTEALSALKYCSQSNEVPGSSPSQDQRKKSSKRRKMQKTWTKITDMAIGDGYGWRKYGQKEILNAKYERCYYRCTYWLDKGCPATKQVQRTEDDPPKFVTKYTGHHTCHDVLDSSLLEDYTSEEGPLLNFESTTPTKQEPPILSSLPSSKDEHKKSFPSIKSPENNLPSSSDILPPEDIMIFNSSTPTPVLPPTPQPGEEDVVSGYNTGASSTYWLDEGCPTAKQVQRTEDDPQKFVTKYTVHHTCHDVLNSSFLEDYTSKEGPLLNFESTTPTKQEPPILSSLPSSEEEHNKSFPSIKSPENNLPSLLEYLRLEDLMIFNSSTPTPVLPPISQPGDGDVISGYITSSSSTYWLDEGCPAAKQVQRTEDDPPKSVTKYTVHHSCHAVFNSSFLEDYTSEEGPLLSFESTTLTVEELPILSSLPSSEEEHNKSFPSIKSLENNLPSLSEYLPPEDLTIFNSSTPTPVLPPTSYQGDEDLVSGYNTGSSSSYVMDMELIDSVYLDEVFLFSDEELFSLRN